MDQANVGGYSFSPQKASGGITVSNPLAGTSERLGNLIGKYSKIKQGNETDFMQAMVDHAAGVVKEQSWLTPDAYNQGVAYSKFIDDQSKMTAALPDISRKVLESGGDLDAFKKELQPHLTQLATSLEQSGLDGDALLAAQKQNITFIASAMDTFQKQRELGLKQKVNETSYGIVNSTINSWESSGSNPQNFTGFLNGAYQQLKAVNAGDADPIGTASTLIADSVKSYAKRANPATAEGQQAIQAIAQYVTSPEATQLSPKAYNDLQDVLAEKQQTVMSYNANVLEQGMVEAERMFDAGEIQFTSADFATKYKEIQVQTQQGKIDSASGMRLINKLQTFEQKALKTSLQSTVALTGTFAQRTAEFGSDADSKSTDFVVKQANKIYGENYDGAAKYIISTGIATNNASAVTAGFKQYMSQMDAVFSVKPEDIPTKLDDVHRQAYQGFVKQIQSLQSTSPYMLSKALDAIPDKDTRDAFEAYLSTSTTAGKNIQFDMKEVQRYKEQIVGARSGGSGAGLSGLKHFTADDLKSGFFASHTWPIFGEANSGKPNSWWNNPSDEVLEKRAQLLNQALDSARPELAAMSAQGQVIVTPAQQIRALRELGRVIPIDTGIVTANKGWKDSLRVGNDPNLKVTPDLLQGSLELIRDRYYEKFNGYGDRKFKKEDVQMTVVGNELLISATDKTGQRMTPLQRYGTSVVNETAWQINESRKKNQGTLPVGIIQSGQKKFTVTKDWTATFGDELGKDIASSFVQYEGNIGSIKATDTSRPNVVTTSIGIRMDGTHGDWEKKILEGRKNGTEDQVVGAFVKDYFKGFNGAIKYANLPDPKNLSMTGLKDTYIALAHAMWQRGAQGGAKSYGDMIKTAQSDPQKAVEMFYKSAIFDDINSTSNGKGKDHPRTKMYLKGLMDVSAVYNARAVAGLQQKLNFGDPFAGVRLPQAKDIGLPMRGEITKSQPSKLNLPQAKDFGLPMR